VVPFYWGWFVLASRRSGKLRLAAVSAGLLGLIAVFAAVRI
jgi:hypothetical protein